MAPNGNIYFPGDTYEEDFSAVSVAVRKTAVFVHEATHLYQWYGLGQTVWFRGPFERDYDYELVPGKKFQDYGLEEMGMIAEHYYRVRSGQRVGKLSLADFQDLLPLK